MMMEMGRHYIFELFGCKSSILDDLPKIEGAMVAGAEKAGATVVGKVFHKFAPQGVTGVVIIAESHISIHTWPERGYAAVDIFTCSGRTDPMKAFDVISALLKPSTTSVMEIKRGMMEVRE
jgi:S-adenosylmethionine decarboxylase proenzyme